MRAGVLYGPGDLRVEERAQPIPGPADVVVRVTYNGLCGTDATEYAKGPMMVPLHRRHPGSGHVGPTVLGHEFIGAVVDAGSDARHLVGQRIASGAGVSCGSCRRCRQGRTNLCAAYYTLGLNTHGGLAEFVAAPASTCVAIPDDCADSDAALAQPLAVGLHAVRRAGIHPGDTVVVAGAGAIGAFILSGLGSHDGPVIAADIDQDRLVVAEGLGATSSFLLPRDAGPDALRDVVPGGADVVFETSGVTGATARAFRGAAPGGTVVQVGLNQTRQPLNLAEVVLREVDLITTVAHVCAQDMPEALRRLAGGSLSGLLDRIVPLEDVVAQGFEPLVAGLAAGKILVDPRRG